MLSQNQIPALSRLPSSLTCPTNPLASNYMVMSALNVTNFLEYSIYGLTPVHPVLNAVMAKFKDVNPYRWPGWSVTALAVLLGLLVLVFFTETRSLSQVKFSTMKCTCLTGLTLSAQLKSKSKIQFLVSQTHIIIILYIYTITAIIATGDICLISAPLG